MSDEIRADSVFDGKLFCGVMMFNDKDTGDTVDEGVRIVQVVDTEADEIEFMFETFNPKRTVYLRFNKDSLAITLSEAMK